MLQPLKRHPLVFPLYFRSTSLIVGRAPARDSAARAASIRQKLICRGTSDPSGNFFPTR